MTDPHQLDTQARAPGVTSSCFLDNSMNGDPTTSLGSPFQCLTTPSMKKLLCFGTGLLCHSVPPHHPTPRKLCSTHSNLEKVLCSPATRVVRALLPGASPKAQPAQTKLGCPTAAMASEISLVSPARSPVFLPADVLPTHIRHIRQSSNHKLSSNFLALTAPFCAAR